MLLRLEFVYEGENARVGERRAAAVDLGDGLAVAVTAGESDGVDADIEQIARSLRRTTPLRR